MRIIVFSDSHGNYGALCGLARKHREDGTVFLHLGDGEREFYKLSEEFPELETRGVCGNCDWNGIGKKSDILRIGKEKIFFTHGHIFHVKSGLEELRETAWGLGVSMALFGHTHTPYSEYRDGLYLFNPGSVSSTRGSASYGIIDITGAGIAPHIVRI